MMLDALWSWCNGLTAGAAEKAEVKLEEGMTAFVWPLPRPLSWCLPLDQQ